MDMSGQLHALVTLPARKDSYLHTPLVPLNIRVGTPQSRCGRFGLEKTLFPLLWVEPQFLGYPFGSLINIPTTLARLLFILLLEVVYTLQSSIPRCSRQQIMRCECKNVESRYHMQLDCSRVICRWSHQLNEIIKKRVRRNILGPKKEKVPGGGRKVLNGYVHDLYPAPHMINV
jgi:hypothetical protein